MIDRTEWSRAVPPAGGCAGLSDRELLGLVQGGPRLGRRLLDRAGSLRGLASWSVAELETVAGPRAARRLAAAMEIGRRAGAERLPRGAELCGSAAVYRHFRGLLRDERREVFLAVLVDVKMRVLREVRISEGSLSASLVHPREAFAAAVREPAFGVVFVHNHPSGDPAPSEEDAALTRRLVAAGDLLGIKVYDHVVCGEESWYSFADSGRLR
jgi:DNA repair protein RadC